MILESEAAPDIETGRIRLHAWTTPLLGYLQAWRDKQHQ